MKDVTIIGTGAAGYTAAIYAQRYGLKTLLIGEVPGGTAINAYKIENYPGFKEISGMELMDKFRDHVVSLGAEIVDGRVDSVKKLANGFEVSVGDKVYQSATVIMAQGTVRRKLGVPGEKEFDGKGVAYCATCDGPFYKGKTVAVVGGSDAATMASTLLTQYCPQVYLIARGSKLKGEPIWIDRVKQDGKIKVILETNVVKIKGDQTVTSVELDKSLKEPGKADSDNKELSVDGVFIEIGAEPASELADDLGVELNDGRRIIVDCEQQTNIAGVFAAGDITDKTAHFEQIVNSAAQGARAANSSFQFLKDR